MMVKDLAEIDATLAQGRLLNKFWMISLSVILLIIALFPLSTVVFLIISIAADLTWDGLMISCIVCGNAFFLAMMALLIYYLKRNYNLRKKVLKCIEDAEQIQAYSKSINKNWTFHNGAKLEIRFRFRGKKYVRISGKPEHEHKMLNGYDKVFIKYENKIINILYSPKYDEVLILKK